MRKFGIVIICLIFFILVGPVFLAFNLQKYVVSSPENIKKVLVDINAYERLTKVKASDLVELIQPENRDEQSQIPEETLQNMIDAITPEMAQEFVENTLDSFYNTSQNGGNEVVMDLRQIKNATINSQPAEIQTELDKTIPDTYTLNNPVKPIFPYLKYFSGVAKYAGMIILLILAIVVISLGNGIRGKFATFGTISLLAAISLLSIHYLSAFIPFSKISSGNENVISTEAFSVLRDFLKGIWNIISSAFNRQGILFGSCAVIFFLILPLLPSRSSQPQNPVLRSKTSDLPTNNLPPFRKPPESIT